MPSRIRESSSSASSSVNDGGWPGNSVIVSDDEYPAVYFDGQAERPLSEQLTPIAVVGMGCRLPGDVSSPAQFWDIMINKGTGRTPKVPSSRFNIDAHLHSNNERPGSFNVPGGYFLNSSLQEFDPAMFNISPIEAMWMDPQQRKLLEVVYEAFESGGVTLSQIENTNTAVFVGSFTSDFQQMSFKEPDFRHSYAATGVDPGIISNRISHVFNLWGPSITVNTACSSSVYAMHNACNALRNNECNGAVVGGTNLVLTVDQHMNTAKLGVLSPDSTCHTFDESANGYGRADGVGAVYLKRLSDAIRDGDPIRGVLRSSAVNSNGKVPAVGITHPNLEGQAKVIQHAYKRGGDLDPRLTGYFECHGTGTPIGDPLEVHAVSQAMNKKGVKRTTDPTTDALWIGAVKTNIGHSEAASGLSAIIKAVLTVENGIIPPIRGLVNPNPKIDWQNWNVKVPSEPQPFPAHLPVRRVSVNSFGYGGTNGHFIVEGVNSLVPGYSHGQAKSKVAARGAFNQRRPFLLPFSAHDKPTLMRNIEAYSKIVGNYDLLDLSYTLANRRTKFPSRGFTVSSHEAVTDAFSNIAESFVFAEKKKAPVVGFAFTGQGAQWARMGNDLMTYYPSFLRTIRRLDQVLGDLPNGPEWTLEDTLLEDESRSRVNEAEFSQPLCTAIQIALVDLLESWGITPRVTVGHSSGEIAASYAAGLIGFSEAIIAAYFRGRVVKDINTHGAMMAVGLGAEAVQPYLYGYEGQVVVACDNSPALVTLSGDASALDAIKPKLDADKVFARIVKTGGKAYHSHHMKPSAVHYKAFIQESRLHVPMGVPKTTNAIMVSSVTNTLLDPTKPLDEHYWSANLVSPVLFNQAIQIIGTESTFKNVDLLIEIGPHSALSGPIKQICREHGFDKLSYLPTIERGGNSASQLLKVAGQLFLRNYELNLERITAVEEISAFGKSRLKKGQLLVDLPTYQWNYSKDLWAEPRHSVEHRAPKHARHDVLGNRLPGGSKAEPMWRNRLRIIDIPWLKHHSLGGEAVFPAAGYFGMAIEAITQMNEDSTNPVDIQGYTLRDVSIKAALVTPDDNDGIETLFSLRPSVYNDTSGTFWWDFNVSSCSEDGHWNDHMTGSIGINARTRGQTPKEVPRMSQRATGKAWNQALKDVGFDYGPSFQDMQNIRSDGQRFHAASSSTVKSTSGIVEGESRYAIHPATIDSCLQLIIVSIYAGRITDMTCGAVPIQVDEVSIWPPTEAQLKNSEAQAYSWTDQRGIRSFDSGTQLVASDGELLLAITNMRCVAYEAAVPQRSEAAIKEQPFMEMAWNIDIDTLNSKSPIEKLGVSDLVALSAFKNPGINVLEFDAPNPIAICEKVDQIRYTATAATQDAFEVLKLAISGFGNATALKVDPALELEEQSLRKGKFDLIIAGTITDATKLYELLAPGGRVIAEQRASAGFDKIFSVQSLSNGLIIGTAREEQTISVTNAINRSIAVLYRNKPTDISEKVTAAVGKLGPPRLVKLEHAEIKSPEHVVMLADLEGPLLSTLKENELSALRQIVSNASTITWVSAGGLTEGVVPEQAMASGLARSVSSEMASLDFTILDLNLKKTTLASAVSEVVEALNRQINNTKGKESEYCVQDGLVYISRLVPNKILNSTYGPQSSTTEAIPYTKSNKLVGAVQAGKLLFTPDPRADETVKADEIQVQVSLTALNKEDVLVLNGTDYPTTFSHEIYGVVTQKGSGVTNFEVGDRVFGFSCDKLATFQTVVANLVQKVQPGDIAQELVTLPMAYATALHGLNTLARVEPGETVLILHGTGDSGAAAISISKTINAKTYVAVRSDVEAAEVAKAFDLPAENIIPVCDETVMARVKQLTGGRNIDVVFSSGYVSPTVAHECWREIASFGRFIDIGRKNVLKRSALDVVPMNRGASYLSFDILDLYKEKPHLLSGYLRITAALYRKKTIPAIGPIVKKNITEIDSAVASFTDDFTGTKTVIENAESEGLLKVIPRRAELNFRPDATYFLVGALGGLGRSLTTWMIKRGAKRFAFMSRTGADKEDAAVLIRDIESKGVTCQIIKGDAANERDVERALQSIPSNYPIRGVVQAAMVLRDGLFHSMTYDSWKTSISPKVHGTINLHRALADVDLDFFVCTSSTSGILGTPGQANYAASNSFLDSLARHRVSAGKRGASLVLPMVQGVGVVAENPEIEAALRRKGIYGIDETHLLESFEAAMITQTSAAPADHIIVGLDPSKLQKSLSEADVTDSFWVEDSRFKSILQTIDSTKSSENGGSGFTVLKAIHEAKSLQEAIDIVIEHFTNKLSRLLLLELDVFEPEVIPIADYGLDSMIGAELRNWIFKEYALDIPFQQLLGPSLTIAKFAAVVCANQGLE